jgi:hypothetical protein
VGLVAVEGPINASSGYRGNREVEFAANTQDGFAAIAANENHATFSSAVTTTGLI